MGILITLMRAVQAGGGRAGGLVGSPPEHCRTQCNGRTLRGGDVNSSHQGRQFCKAQGRRWWLLIRLIFTARDGAVQARKVSPLDKQRGPGISSCRLAQQGGREVGYQPAWAA